MVQGSRASSLFSLLASLSLALALTLANARFFFSVPLLGAWDHFVFFVVLVYLAIITFRAGIVIILSFASRYFQAEFEETGRRPMVSILVPCFNEEVVVRHAIDTLLKIDYPNYEIIVIDDGSTDTTLLSAMERETKHKMRVIHQKNQGKAEALNRGLAEAMGEFVLSVDADGALQPDVLNRGMSYFDRDPDLAAVAGSVTIGNPNSLIGLFQQLEYVTGLNLHKAAQSFMGAVNIVPGPIGLFRKSMVLDIGGYRTDNFAEDCDLTLRLLMRGHHIVYCADMVALTEAPEEFGSLLKQRYRWARGTIQAIKQNAVWLSRPFENPRNFFILAYFTVETLLLPAANFLFAVSFIEHATIAGEVSLMGPFFLQLSTANLVLAAVRGLFGAPPFPFTVRVNRKPLNLRVGHGAAPLRLATG